MLRISQFGFTITTVFIKSEYSLSLTSDRALQEVMMCSMDSAGERQEARLQAGLMAGWLEERNSLHIKSQHKNFR